MRLQNPPPKQEEKKQEEEAVDEINKSIEFVKDFKTNYKDSGSNLDNSTSQRDESALMDRLKAQERSFYYEDIPKGSDFSKHDLSRLYRKYCERKIGDDTVATLYGLSFTKQEIDNTINDYSISPSMIGFYFKFLKNYMEIQRNKKTMFLTFVVKNFDKSSSLLYYDFVRSYRNKYYKKADTMPSHIKNVVCVFKYDERWIAAILSLSESKTYIIDFLNQELSRTSKDEIWSLVKVFSKKEFSLKMQSFSYLSRNCVSVYNDCGLFVCKFFQKYAIQEQEIDMIDVDKSEKAPMQKEIPWLIFKTFEDSPKIFHIVKRILGDDDKKQADADFNIGSAKKENNKPETPPKQFDLPNFVQDLYMDSPLAKQIKRKMTVFNFQLPQGVDKTNTPPQEMSDTPREQTNPLKRRMTYVGAEDKMEKIKEAARPNDEETKKPYQDLGSPAFQESPMRRQMTYAGAEDRMQKIKEDMKAVAEENQQKSSNSNTSAKQNSINESIKRQATPSIEAESPSFRKNSTFRSDRSSTVTSVKQSTKKDVDQDIKEQVVRDVGSQRSLKSNKIQERSHTVTHADIQSEENSMITAALSKSEFGSKKGRIKLRKSDIMNMVNDLREEIEDSDTSKTESSIHVKAGKTITKFLKEEGAFKKSKSKELFNKAELENLLERFKIKHNLDVPPDPKEKEDENEELTFEQYAKKYQEYLQEANEFHNMLNYFNMFNPALYEKVTIELTNQIEDKLLSKHNLMHVKYPHLQSANKRLKITQSTPHLQVNASFTDPLQKDRNQNRFDDSKEPGSARLHNRLEPLSRLQSNNVSFQHSGQRSLKSTSSQFSGIRSSVGFNVNNSMNMSHGIVKNIKPKYLDPISEGHLPKNQDLSTNMGEQKRDYVIDNDQYNQKKKSKQRSSNEIVARRYHISIDKNELKDLKKNGFVTKNILNFFGYYMQEKLSTLR